MEWIHVMVLANIVLLGKFASDSMRSLQKQSDLVEESHREIVELASRMKKLPSGITEKL